MGITSWWLGLMLMVTFAAADNSSRTAEHQTRALLTDPAARNKALEANPSARNADAQARAALGAGGSEGSKAAEQDVSRLYQITAEIFSDMVRDSGGDPVKMQELAAKAAKDPEAFMKGLSPEQRQSIQKLAREIEARKAAPQRP